MTRHKTYFGIPLPYFREESHGDGGFTIRFVLQGRIPSKKNHQMAVPFKKEAQDFVHARFKEKGQISLNDALAAVDMVKAKMIGNKAYYAFLKAFRPVIEAQMKAQEAKMAQKGLKFPLKKARLSLKFYYADRHITDTVNKQQSIQDLLVDCGVVANDDYGTLNPISSSSTSFYQELRENICLVLLYCKVDNFENSS